MAHLLICHRNSANSVLIGVDRPIRLPCTWSGFFCFRHNFALLNTCLSERLFLGGSCKISFSNCFCAMRLQICTFRLLCDVFSSQKIVYRDEIFFSFLVLIFSEVM